MGEGEKHPRDHVITRDREIEALIHEEGRIQKLPKKANTED
jgi:hypothetical protein